MSFDRIGIISCSFHHGEIKKKEKSNVSITNKTLKCVMFDSFAQHLRHTEMIKGAFNKLGY